MAETAEVSPELSPRAETQIGKSGLHYSEHKLRKAAPELVLSVQINRKIGSGGQDVTLQERRARKM